MTDVQKCITLFVFISSLVSCTSCYPLSGSWFKDRFTLNEWNDTLDAFKEIGGDTVILRAPPIELRTKYDILHDPVYQQCINPKTGLHCIEDTERMLGTVGANITGWATYDYEENYSLKVQRCPDLDIKIDGPRIFHRIILVAENNISPCKFINGSKVFVLFTSFAGIDPHSLLLQSAAPRNVTVFFSLPGLPLGFLSNETFYSYLDWVGLVLDDHKYRYMSFENQFSPISSVNIPRSQRLKRRDNPFKIVERNLNSYTRSGFNPLKGYYSTLEASLCTCARVGSRHSVSDVDIYTQVGRIVHSHEKLFMVTPQIMLNRFLQGASIGTHVVGFEKLVNTGVIDILAVVEGRGTGKGAYFWDSQRKANIQEVDSTLFNIIKERSPDKINSSSTFSDVFTGSIQQLYRELESSREELLNKSVRFDMWLNIEAYELVHTKTPCLPIDTRGSGMDQLVQRTSKGSLDLAIAGVGSRVQKIVAFAWDPLFLCTDPVQGYNGFQESLAAQIDDNLGSTIISDCRFHSPQNLSVVVIGYVLAPMPPSYNVTWPDAKGQYHSSPINGYYYEIDYGLDHDRVNSLEYCMLWDFLPLNQFAKYGTVYVSPGSGGPSCAFKYGPMPDYVYKNDFGIEHNIDL